MAILLNSTIVIRKIEPGVQTSELVVVSKVVLFLVMYAGSHPSMPAVKITGRLSSELQEVIHSSWLLPQQ